MPLRVVLNSSIAFLTLWAVSRILGKKLISQMTFFDFVTGISIGSIGASMAIDTDMRPINGVLALLTFLIWTAAFGIITVKSYLGRKILDDEPTVLIQNGKVLEGNLNRVRYTLNELLMQLREKDIFDISKVEFAMLEPDGKITVLRKSQHEPITPKDLKMTTSYRGMATEIIVDGTILEQNLSQNNLSKDWLLSELKSRGIDDASKVVFAELNTDGELYVDVKDDSGYQQRIEDFPR